MRIWIRDLVNPGSGIRNVNKSIPRYISRIRITAVLISEWLLLFGALLFLLVPRRDFRIWIGIYK
jgi:hypothetical protein